MPPSPETRRRRAATGELGHPGITSGVDGGFLDSWETTAELRWPTSIQVYDRMRVDAHIEGCLDAIGLPIRRSRWDLDPDSLQGVRPEVIRLVREDLGIAERGQRLRRRRGGVVWGDYLRHALLSLPFGFMIFEQVYDLIDGQARLRKLAPRMPRTITGWDLAADGGLRAIKQIVPRSNGMWDEVTIPIDRLVVFTREKEGSDPSGRSILRSCYVHWDYKQKLIKVDAIAAERNGMGFPKVTYASEGGGKNDALDIARNVRTGEYAGVALEQGVVDLELIGVDGKVREILPSIRYHDQEMSRRMLAMFLDLGHDNGARSLGDTFVDFFVMAEQSVAAWIEDVTNEYVIRDLVELNFGPDEPYPLVVCDEITADSDLTAESLKQLAESGFLIPDVPTENVLRRRYGLPELDPETPRPDPAAAVEETPDAGTIAELEAKVARLKAGPRAAPVRLPSEV